MPPGRLTGPELREVREAIYVAFDLASFDALLEDYIDVRSDKYFASKTEPFPTILRAVISGLAADGYLEQLLEALVTERPNHQKIQLLRRLAPAAPMLGGDPYDVGKLCLIDNSLPLFDRSTLRRELHSLGGGQRRTLVINGGRLSGKSYTRYLLDFVARMSRRFQFVYCDLRLLAAGGRIPPERLARLIAAPMQLGDSLPARGPETPEAWAADFAAWLEGKLAAGEQTYWVVIDHCNSHHLDLGSPELLVNLASRAETQDHLRLILMDYPDVVTLRSLQLRRVVEEKVEPITEDHVREFFRTVHYQLRYPAGGAAPLPANDPAVDESVQNTWGQVDRSQEGWLGSLGSLVESELERIRL